MSRIGRSQHCEPGEFLQRIEDFAILANQAFQRRVIVLGKDRNVGTSATDFDVDVAVQISDIQKLFKVVGCDVAFVQNFLIVIDLVFQVGRVDILSCSHGYFFFRRFLRCG